MQFATLLSLAAVVGSALAQRPSNTSICDYYTTALLKNNTAANQYKLLELIVNTAAIGNYTTPNVGVVVPGLLSPGNVNGTAVNLAPYFTGALASTNRSGMATSVNFLDGGGATPLKSTMLPTNGTNQYRLLTHLYQYFGALLGCSTYGMAGFPAYAGAPSMAAVHGFMDLNQYEMAWFIQNVGLSAKSFGAADADVEAVGMALTSTFDYRCSAPATVIPAQGAQLQAMCQASTCPLAANNSCSAYPNNGVAVMPQNATSGQMASGSAIASSVAATMGGGAAPTGASGSGSGSSSSAAGAAATGLSFAAAALGAAAVVAAL